MDIHYHINDIPADLDWGDSIAIDTETLGLKPHRDRLCVVQISKGDGQCHLVHFPSGDDYSAPNLKKLLSDQSITKIFHYARFDLATLDRYLGVMCTPTYCTKVASKLARTYTDRHGLRDLCNTILGIDISKQQQTSDWGAETLTDAQKEYAATDVLYLHKLRDKMTAALKRDGRWEEAQACFEFLPTRAKLDLMGFEDVDIFIH